MTVILTQDQFGRYKTKVYEADNLVDQFHPEEDPVAALMAAARQYPMAVYTPEDETDIEADEVGACDKITSPRDVRHQSRNEAPLAPGEVACLQQERRQLLLAA